MILRFFRRKSQPDVQLEQGLEKTRRGVFSEITRLFERGAGSAEDGEQLLQFVLGGVEGKITDIQILSHVGPPNMHHAMTNGPNSGLTVSHEDKSILLFPRRKKQLNSRRKFFSGGNDW